MKIFGVIFCCIFSTGLYSQSPGQIVRPAGGRGATVLNPNGDGFSSATTGGFTANDITESEIVYKVVPATITEPTGDVATGPSGGFTDIVKVVDGSGFYIYSNGTNIYFRLRIGSIISGSKAYSALIDTDGKMGSSGPNADTNYVAPTNTSNGNPGFEYEVVLQTNFQVAVYNVDGKTNPGAPVATYSLNTNSQISTALSTDGNNPDYFYDWFAPLSAIGSPASFRIVATTVTSPSSALQGNRSDIYGIDDAKSTVSGAWVTITNAQPAITISSIGSAGAGVSAVATAAPSINAPVSTGTNISVTGSWTALDASKPSPATVTLYKNNVAVNMATVATGGSWNIIVPTVATGDIFYAKAVASGESSSLQSNNVTAGCTAIPAAATISCASSKGITGTIPLGTTVSIYQITSANASPTSAPLTTGLVYITNASNQTFNYYGPNSQSGDACQGQTNALTTNNTYMMVVSNGGCLSAPTFICITGANRTAWNYISSNAIALGTPVYSYQTAVSGTGAVNGQVLRLYVNKKYIAAVTATGSSFSFSNLSLQKGDTLNIYAQTSGTCMTVSSNFGVRDFIQPPLITTNAAGNLLSTSTAISGTSALPGASVTLYRGTSPTGISVGTATVSSTGTWVVSGLSLTANEMYYATQSSGDNTSPSSQTAVVLAPTTAVPSFAKAMYLETDTTITGSITSFTGTIRVSLDGTLIGTTNLTNATSWSIPANKTYSNQLYAGGALTVSAQAAGSAENTSSSTATVTCTSPAQPAITPTTATINTGQPVTFNVSNVVAGTWYAVSDNTGSSYATSVYSADASNFTLPTKNFSPAGTYNLKLSADKLTGCPSSYNTAIITVTGASLPVHFIQVSAKTGDDGIKVSWMVSNEQNIAFYTVERSEDCKHFSEAGQVAYHSGTADYNQYSFTDSTPFNADRRCYRIRQSDLDGHVTYSTVVSVYSNKDNNNMIVSPNPAKEMMNISFTSAIEQKATVELADMNGKVFYTRIIQLHRGKNVHTVQGLQAFSRGNVVVKLTAGNEVHSKKVIIQ